MFFSWYTKNKHFKSGGSLSGQIAPFLIVILAILLVAAISTVNIGRVSIDKTCSANGADAGSLAAASAWSGALNNLCEWNLALNEYYDMNYYTYGQLQETAEDYADEALLYSVAAAVETSISVSIGPATCGSVYVQGLVGMAADLLGAILLFQAYQATTALIATAEYMKSLTESFHEQQWKNFCDAVDYMDESYINARKAGLSYAFSNSCIPAKLTNQQSDVFSAWLSGDGFWGASTAPGILSGAYSWSDNAVATHPVGVPVTTNNHTVSISLDLPDIATYDLQHTVGTYQEIINKLDDLIDEATTIANIQYSTATILGTSAALFLVEFILSIVYIIVNAIPFVGPAIAAAICALLIAMTTEVQIMHVSINLIVDALVNISCIAIAVLLALLGDDTTGLWAPDGVTSKTGCADAEELMIVKISSLTMESQNRWTAICCVSQVHPATSVGIVPTSYPQINSCGEAKFSGGDVGAFPITQDTNTYDPSIVGTN